MTEEDNKDLYKVGDQLYRVGRDGIELITIMKVLHYPHCVYKDDRGHSFYNRTIRKSCFDTEEEAEKEVRRRKHIIEKRQELKLYEAQLNEKYGLKNHFIVK